MGIKGISLLETKEIFSIHDKNEPRTKWIIGPLDSDIYDIVVGQENHLKIAAEAVRFGLKNFEGFTIDNKEVKFKSVSRPMGRYNYRVVSDDIMKALPPEIKIEIGTEILKLSHIDEEETKN